MLLYRIKDWAKHFENNRTRELVKMAWVPVPNKHDGDGFTDLMSRPNAMALYGAWHLILQVASKCDPRGTLSREGAVPHNGISLARVSRGDSRVLDEMLKVGVEIGWIEVLDSATQQVIENPAPSCDNPAPSCIEGKGMEGKEVQDISAPKKVRVRSTTPKSDTPELKPLTIWKAVFRNVHHVEYKDGGPCRGAAKTLKGAYGVNEEHILRFRMKAYLQDEDPYLSRIGWPLIEFAKRHNKYGNPPAPKPEPPKEQDDAGFLNMMKGKA